MEVDNALLQAIRDRSARWHAPIVDEDDPGPWVMLSVAERDALLAEYDTLAAEASIWRRVGVKDAARIKELEGLIDRYEMTLAHAQVKHIAERDKLLAEYDTLTAERDDLWNELENGKPFLARIKELEDALAEAKRFVLADERKAALRVIGAALASRSTSDGEET